MSRMEERDVARAQARAQACQHGEAASRVAAPDPPQPARPLPPRSRSFAHEAELRPYGSPPRRAGVPLPGVVSPEAAQMHFRRLSAPVHPAAFQAWPGVSSDDGSSPPGSPPAGETEGWEQGAGGSPQTHTSSRRAVLRALRRRSQSRRAARVSFSTAAGGSEESGAPHAAPLPCAAELAARISRLDAHLQRYLLSQLVQLEASQALAAQAALAGPRPQSVTWSLPGEEEGLLPAAPASAPAEEGDDDPAYFYPPHHRRSVSHSHADWLLEEEGGPVGGMPPSEGGPGYASPGERDTSCSDASPRRPARFSLVGVAGEMPLPLPRRPSDDERELQTSPRVLGPSALRLAARRMTHGRVPGDEMLAQRVNPSHFVASGFRNSTFS